MCTDNRLRKKQETKVAMNFRLFRVSSRSPSRLKSFITTKATTRKASFANITALLEVFPYNSISFMLLKMSSRCRQNIREFKIYDATVAKTSFKIASSSLSFSSLCQFV